MKLVEQAVTSLNARDIDAYLGCCAEDIELRTPAAEVGGVYEGRDAIRRFWADISDTAPDFRLEIDGMESISDDQVLASMRVSATGRASGIAVLNELPTTNIYDFAGGKIRRVRVLRDRREALEAVGLSEQDAQAGS